MTREEFEGFKQRYENANKKERIAFTEYRVAEEELLKARKAYHGAVASYAETVGISEDCLDRTLVYNAKPQPASLT